MLAARLPKKSTKICAAIWKPDVKQLLEEVKLPDRLSEKEFWDADDVDFTDFLMFQVKNQR